MAIAGLSFSMWGVRTARLPLVAGAMAAALVAGGLAGSAAAQQPKKAASPFSGFSPDSGKPVDIKSDSLEVHQNEQKAIFTGGVVATQGESTLRSQTLTVFYDNAQADEKARGKPASPDKPAQDKPAKDQSASSDQPAGATETSAIKRLEAGGGVIVTSQDQKATGQNGVFDMKSNTATLTGDVVLTQGPNVIRGKQLVVDLKTGVAHVIGGTTGLFVPSSQKK